jgi:hypothetical protein
MGLLLKNVLGTPEERSERKAHRKVNYYIGDVIEYVETVAIDYGIEPPYFASIDKCPSGLAKEEYMRLVGQAAVSDKLELLGLTYDHGLALHASTDRDNPLSLKEKLFVAFAVEQTAVDDTLSDRPYYIASRPEHLD